MNSASRLAAMLFCASLLLDLMNGAAHSQEDATDPKTIGRILHSMVWTGKEALVWGGGSEGKFFNHGLRIEPVTRARSAISADGAPSGRWAHAAVWTGSKMIIWGGRQQFESNSHVGDGALYDPYLNSWSPMSTENAPEPRSQMAAVWTGSEMLVWGGFGDGAKAHNTGGRYNPLTNTWRPMSTDNAPSAASSRSMFGREETFSFGAASPPISNALWEMAPSMIRLQIAGHRSPKTKSPQVSGARPQSGQAAKCSFGAAPIKTATSTSTKSPRPEQPTIPRPTPGAPSRPKAHLRQDSSTPASGPARNSSSGPAEIKSPANILATEESTTLQRIAGNRSTGKKPPKNAACQPPSGPAEACTSSAAPKAASPPSPTTQRSHLTRFISN